ncbi:PIN domain-containing protein [Moraxella sp. FZFQ2102]|uniref:PIN domain-containing protein n=1 Tax=Moraxella sp. FZFQ2102 TaxID=2953752 RepID=UPI00209BD36C|nr:PIN domain-containing protein [Moraxella sp. FZFQ2102]USZ15013.1 PIN domain-containing protein [Moraxella sp. FZFQ2102]
MKYLLIDFENIQPKNLDQLPYDQVQVWLFVGAKQQNLPTTLTNSLLKFKYKPQIIHLQKSGKNVLDFYLSYYSGQIIAKDPQADLIILSNDKGYDVLFEHIEEQRQAHSIRRTNDIHLVQAMTKSSSKNHAEDQQVQLSLQIFADFDDKSVRKLLDLLNKNNNHRPKKLKSLHNAIINILQCDKETAKKIIKALKKQGWIQLIDNKVIYKR